MYDLLIVGGGPGGVAAASYALHLGLETLLIAPDLGGKVNYAFSIKGLRVTDSVHGAEMVRAFAAKIAPDAHWQTTASAIEEVAGGFRVTVAHGESAEGRALVLCTGATPRRLYVPDEDRLWGHGLSYSAVTHAPFFVGRDVAVIGNDRRAQIAALELCRIAQRVLFITPQPQELDPALLDRLRAAGNADLFKSWEVISIDGDSYVSGVTLQNPNGGIREIKLDGVFVELGLMPNSNFVANLVARDEQGRILIDQQSRTSHPAIFAAGDVTNVYGEQVPIALGDGIKAALSASEYLVAYPHTPS